MNTLTGPAAGDIDTDVVVVGFGAAGAVAAIEAADAGARVVLIEKMAFPGGLSIASAGGIRVSDDPAAALDYLEATCGGRTPSPLLRVLADGMAAVPDYMRRLADRNGATVRVTPALGNYPLPGYESLAYCEVEAVPALEGLPGYHAMQPVKNGTRLFKVLEDNVQARDIKVMFEAPAQRLIVEDGRVTGLTVLHKGRTVTIKTRKAVILACGGFEADAEMQRQYFQVGEVLTGSFRGNTGDGIRMAQAVGADLWHMWHYHGPYGIQHPDPDYPFGLYLKAVPMWTPGRADYVSDLGIGSGPNKVSEKSLARVAWILLDQTGQRFMDEYPPYPGDTGVRPFDAFDAKTQRFPRNPAFIVFDEVGRTMYPLGRVVHNDHHPRYAWSDNNSAEIANGIFQRADGIAHLASIMDVPENRLTESLVRWNDAVRNRNDSEFGRQPETMVAIEKPPFYVGRVRPLVINTQGGPRHNEHQQVLDPFGAPIPRLYAVGELGSLFGYLYMSGGNLTECIVGGWVAGKHASAQEPLPPTS